MSGKSFEKIEIEKLVKENEQLKKQIANQARSVSDLGKQMEYQSKEYGQSKALSIRLESRVRDLADKLQEAEQRADEQIARINKLTCDRAVRDRKIRDLADKLQEAEQRASTFEGAYEQGAKPFEKQIAGLKEQLSAVERWYAEKRDRCTELERDRDEWKKGCEQWAEKSRQWESKWQELKEESKLQTYELGCLRGECTEKQKVIVNRNQRIKELNERVAEQKTRSEPMTELNYELKPCPFCGATGEWIKVCRTYIECKCCGTMGPDGDPDSGDELAANIDAWNGRRQAKVIPTPVVTPVTAQAAVEIWTKAVTPLESVTKKWQKYITQEEWDNLQGLANDTADRLAQHKHRILEMQKDITKLDGDRLAGDIDLQGEVQLIKDRLDDHIVRILELNGKVGFGCTLRLEKEMSRLYDRVNELTQENRQLKQRFDAVSKQYGLEK